VDGEEDHMDRDPVGSENADARLSGSREIAVPRYLRWGGSALGLGLIVEFALGASPLFPFGGVLPARILTSVPFVVGILYASYWLDRGGVSPERHARIALWVLASTVVFVVINLGIMIGVPPANSLIGVGWLRWAVSLGAGVGLTIGIVEARAIEREVIAEQARVQFDGSERRAELLEYVEDLLSAEIGPLAEAISGEAARLSEQDATESDQASLAPIRRQADALVTTADHVRGLLESAGDAAGREPMNLTAALTDAVERTRRDSSVETALSLPETEVFVRADQLLGRVFASVIEYLAGRSGTSKVSVAVDATDDAVTVRIADDGPPLSGDGSAITDDGQVGEGAIGDTGTERGFALARVLVEHYDGELERESGPDGNAVTIELRRVAVEGARPPPEPASNHSASP
jgi:signal transduction histidine kinase